MTTKDWVLLLLPIALNGVVLALFQKFVIDKYIKHRMLKDEIVKTFLDMLKDLKSHIIQSNFDSMINGDSVNENIAIMQNKIVEIVKYYHTNNYDLKRFQKKFNVFNEGWMSFQNYHRYCATNVKFNEEMRLKLGDKLQVVFDTLEDLSESVRKKY